MQSVRGPQLCEHASMQTCNACERAKHASIHSNQSRGASKARRTCNTDTACHVCKACEVSKAFETCKACKYAGMQVCTEQIPGVQSVRSTPGIQELACKVCNVRNHFKHAKRDFTSDQALAQGRLHTYQHFLILMHPLWTYRCNGNPTGSQMGSPKGTNNKNKYSKTNNNKTKCATKCEAR